jgi:hypothetical protein
MIDESRAAQLLYGTPQTPSTTVKPTPAEARATDPVKPDADAGVEAQPASLYGTRAADTPGDALTEEERIAIRNTHGSTQRLIHGELTSRAGWDVEAARESAKITGEMAHRYALTSDQSGHLAEAAIGAQVNGVSEEQLVEWQAASRDALRVEFGPDGADQALRDAQKLVARDPELTAFLARTGLHAHPKFIITAANIARRMRLEGKL